MGCLLGKCSWLPKFKVGDRSFKNNLLPLNKNLKIGSNQMLTHWQKRGRLTNEGHTTVHPKLFEDVGKGAPPFFVCADAELPASSSPFPILYIKKVRGEAVCSASVQTEKKVMSPHFPHL